MEDQLTKIIPDTITRNLHRWYFFIFNILTFSLYANVQFGFKMMPTKNMINDGRKNKLHDLCLV